MDPLYDVDEAKVALEDISNRRINTASKMVHLAKVERDDFKLIMFEKPTTWRLTTKNEDNAEAIFHIQGILCTYDLPPIRSGYEGHDALDANARYFTARKFAPDEQNLPFSPGVDTNGTLANMRGMDLIHGADNKVAYLQVMEGPEGKIKYVDIEPNIFQTGDIVEASIAFICVPLRDERFMMTHQLRALTLLDNSIRKKIPSNQRESGPSIRKASSSVKRKPLYEDDMEMELELATSKMRVA